MRIYIRKVNKNIVIYKETLLESIISDIITSFVMILLIALDIVFSIYVIHSFIIDSVVMILFIFYIFGFKNKKEKVTTKDEIEVIINELIN